MNLIREDLNLFVIFAAVAETRSVTLAAEQLALSQPAVSHALARLRQMMDDPLFIRSREGFTLTVRAEAMLVPVKQLLADAERLLVVPAFSPASTARVFRVGSSDYSAITIQPLLAKHLSRQAPHIHLSLQPMNDREQTLNMLKAGELDLSFWGTSRPPGSFYTLELFKERFVGVLHASHPLAERVRTRQITPDEYLAYPHVQVAFGDRRGSQVEPVSGSSVQRDRKILLSTASFVSSLASIIDTDLIVSLPSRFPDFFAESFGLVTFTLPFPQEDYDYSLIWHERMHHDPGIVWLRTLIQSVCSEGYNDLSRPITAVAP